MAPEVANKLNYDTRCDVWSLGVTIAEMTMIALPDDPDQETIFDIKRLYLSPIKERSEILLNFLQKCLETSIEKVIQLLYGFLS